MLETATRPSNRSEGSFVRFTCPLHTLDNLLGLEKPLKTPSKRNILLCVKTYCFVEPGTDVQSGRWIGTIWNNPFSLSSINITFNTFTGKKTCGVTDEGLLCGNLLQWLEYIIEKILVSSWIFLSVTILYVIFSKLMSNSLFDVLNWCEDVHWLHYRQCACNNLITGFPFQLLMKNRISLGGVSLGDRRSSLFLFSMVLHLLRCWLFPSLSLFL